MKNFVQAWTEQAGRQVGMRKEGANKLHRLAMAHLYGSWAPPSTWLHASSPAPACMAAVMAAWSHALQVHAFLYVMLSHSICHAFTLPHLTSYKFLVVWPFLCHLNSIPEVVLWIFSLPQAYSD